MIFRRIIGSFIALIVGVVVMAQEVAESSLSDTLRINRSVLITPKRGLEKATMNLVKSFDLEGFKATEIPIFLDLDSSRLGREPRLKGLNSSLKIEFPSTLETTLGEVMSQRLNLSPNLSLNSFIGSPTHLSFVPMNTSGLAANISASYSINDRMSISSSVVAGQLMGSRFIAPSFTTTFDVSERLKAQLRMGLNLGQSAYQPFLVQQSLNTSLRLQYITPSGFFAYGEGYATRYQLFANLNQMPMLTGSYSYGFGGGIGYNIPGAGPISMGVSYSYNPFTQRIEPVATINIVGGLIYLYQLIEKAIKGD